jgi:glutaredoxin
MLKKFLKANDIEYENKDVERPQFTEELVALTKQEGIPVTVIENQDPILGFDPEKIKQALKIK